MVSVTEGARKELKRMLSEKVDWPGARMRLVDRGQGNIGLGIDIEVPGDHVVEYEGTKVLIIESELATNLKGITLDVDDTPAGAELVLSGKF
jgi:Fe-S cluster assembly iron-binding protein IscA